VQNRSYNKFIDAGDALATETYIRLKALRKQLDAEKNTKSAWL
jgi:hypothetical protein